ncbi:MAG TPA: YihY/virulence factor BrkB family protein [Anaerolineales bacterium]|nr:YihY/virulence factor BrkB family protein [Anaerolineales bacterium]
MGSGREAERSFSNRFEAIYQRANRSSFGILDILRNSFTRFSEKQGIEGAASIAFFTIFALPPLLIVTVTVGSFFLDSLDIQALVLNIAETTLPIPADVVLELINEILTQRTSLGIIGLISLASSATGVLMTISTNVNRAWTEAKPRNFLQNRLVAFIIIGALSASLAVTSILAAVVSVVSELNPLLLPIDIQVSFLTRVLLIVVRTVLFFALYLWVPTVTVRIAPALISALVASLGWELTTTGFSYYLRWGLDYYNLIYGSLGTLVAAMFWVYLNVLIIVYGAHLCAAITHNKTNRQISSEAA